MKIFVLGHKGMLGHMVVTYLESQGINVHTVNQRFPNWDSKIFKGTNYVINCIGAIPQRTNSFKINYELPIWLSNNLDCKIIHPGTDCEIDNDDYGISKKKATDFILNESNNTKILKASIIGPELNSKASLLEWFLSQKTEVFGYTEAIWNGVTTYEWAKQCLKLINNWENYSKLTILSSNPVSKYELLNIIKKVYNKNINIITKKLGKDKTLVGDIETKDIEEQLWELKNLK